MRGVRSGDARAAARLQPQCEALPSPDMRRNNKQLVVVGDRVLVQLEDGEERSKVGLYLPATAVDNQAVQGGAIVATGPGLPLPDPGDHPDEPWRTGAPGRETRHVPMQARVGDYALFFRKAAVEVTFEGERYLVVPQAALLALVRSDDRRPAAPAGTDDEPSFDY